MDKCIDFEKSCWSSTQQSHGQTSVKDKVSMHHNTTYTNLHEKANEKRAYLLLYLDGPASLSKLVFFQ